MLGHSERYDHTSLPGEVSREEQKALQAGWWL